MKRIWKYDAVLGTTILSVPCGARWLDAQIQHGGVTLWALVDDKPDHVDVKVVVVGTGHPIPDSVVEELTYLATVQQGPFVWHVFVGGEK